MPVTEADNKSMGETALLPQKKQSPMPSFRAMVSAAAGVCAVPFVPLLLTRHLWPALGIFGGFVLGIAMGGMLYGFVNYGVSLFVPASVSQGSAQSAGQIGGFAALMIGKFLVIGAVLFVLVVLLKLSILWLVAGFLLTQTTMIGTTLLRLSKTKVTD